ncbi:hypothetical protein [Streptomyces ficellus]|uniref:Uncharacterized protein n=1 Tax=Streptomyces ficellus TaxID=1977088 RepID=A0A6I6FHB3_9ACTN|nr:hypothetical protein [Streptomyces ficellus]QGV80597.1 hypothetical protein EIZ62_21955 [Streptomyces ficellus]
MAASAQLLLSALSKQVPGPAPALDRPVSGYGPGFCPLTGLPEAGAPLTGEPPLADATPLTSEPPLPDATPLTSEPALTDFTPLTSEPTAYHTAGGPESPGA